MAINIVIITNKYAIRFKKTPIECSECCNYNQTIVTSIVSIIHGHGNDKK